MSCTIAPNYYALTFSALLIGWALFQLFWGKAHTKDRGWVERILAPGSFYREVLIWLVAGAFFAWVALRQC